jgi:hypothetical protein
MSRAIVDAATDRTLVPAVVNFPPSPLAAFAPRWMGAT